MENTTTTEDVRLKAYCDVVARVWALYSFKPISDLDISLIARHLMRYFGHWPTAEIVTAFEVALMPDGYEQVQHFGDMTAEWVGNMLKRYVGWKRDVELNKRHARAQELNRLAEAPPIVPSEAKLKAMNRETIARAYKRFLAGDLPTLVPNVVYGILVENKQLTADDYEQHLERAKGIAKARELVRQASPTDRAQKFSDGLEKGWKPEHMAKDMSIRLLFENWQKRGIGNGSNS